MTPPPLTAEEVAEIEARAESRVNTVLASHDRRALLRDRKALLKQLDERGLDIVAQQARINALSARVASLEADARRYGYVRKRITGASVADGRYLMTIEFPVGTRLWMNPDGFDTTVDAALSQEPQT